MHIYITTHWHVCAFICIVTIIFTQHPRKMSKILNHRLFNVILTCKLKSINKRMFIVVMINVLYTLI